MAGRGLRFGPVPDELAERELAALQGRPLNFDVRAHAEPTEADGWTIDDHRQPLPPEPPGEPLSDGSFAIACEMLRRYGFADPRIVRAVYDPERPLEDRTMLLIGRFFSLRFLMGVRVAAVIDEVRSSDSGPVRVWGWSYRTLDGHLEEGQMGFEVRKSLETGAVCFRIAAFSRRAEIRNPVVRIGWLIFGRHMQARFMRNAMSRMRTFVVAELERRQASGTQAAGR